jgi:hypothetical protein
MGNDGLRYTVGNYLNPGFTAGWWTEDTSYPIFILKGKGVLSASDGTTIFPIFEIFPRNTVPINNNKIWQGYLNLSYYTASCYGCHARIYLYNYSGGQNYLVLSSAYGGVDPLSIGSDEVGKLSFFQDYGPDYGNTNSLLLKNNRTEQIYLQYSFKGGFY